MRALSVKLKYALFRETESLRHQLQKSRNAYINEAIAFYNLHQRRALLTNLLETESRLVAENSMHVLRDLEEIDDES